MPTYGYRCRSCDAEFDVVQRMTDPAEASCPACSGAGRRLFYPVGITFKGQGFYKTDSRSTASEAAPTSSKPETNGSPATSPAPAAATPAPAAPPPAPPRTSSAAIPE
ncbi:MAG: FmdB family zinc ribbon protein [Candidatus Dormibacteria bacterium]